MPERKVIPKNCWTCDKSANCYAHYGEGACKYKIAIEERERKSSLQMRKGVGSDEQ